MTTTNVQTGTRIDEVADRIYRIHTPIREMPGGFSFNQYLVVDDDPLLFHTGPRRMGPVVREAIAAVMPVDKLRWISFSHVEADECGGLNDLLAVAPRAQALCSNVAAMVSMNDLADRPPRGLADGETVSLGAKSVTWIDAPHVPHAWENGFLYESSTKTLFSGDLFTQPGAEHEPVTERDILGPSEAFRAAMDYYSHSSRARGPLERMAGLGATTLACMHGAAWHGNSGNLLRALADALGAPR
jgi:flavorubredoxin